MRGRDGGRRLSANFVIVLIYPDELSTTDDKCTNAYFTVNFFVASVTFLKLSRANYVGNTRRETRGKQDDVFPSFSTQHETSKGTGNLSCTCGDDNGKSNVLRDVYRIPDLFSPGDIDDAA